MRITAVSIFTSNFALTIWCAVKYTIHMKSFMRVSLLVPLLLSTIGIGRAFAHHISGYVYCDENSTGEIDAGDRLLDGVLVRATSLTAQPGATFTDTTGDNTPVVAGGPGFYYIQLPGGRSDDLRVDIVSGLPPGSTVIAPPGGFYASISIITGNSATDHRDNVNFLADGCQLCGNGVQDASEECDDGNNVDGDGCNAKCENEFCGDGITQAGLEETCDPAGTPPTNGATCRNDCTYCGDGIRDDSEQCDDGNTVDTDDCRNDCTRCGDGQPHAGEECDDGNNVDGDGCSAVCTLEPYCGDTIIQPELGEQCDPPNVPGCDANCHAAEICTDFVDNDGDGLIDCIDPQCECGPIGRDPGAIRFGPTHVNDLFSVHGSFVPQTQISPSTEAIGFLLSNKNGKVFELPVAAGSLRRLGRNLFRFRDQNATRTRNGLARLDVRYYPQRNNYTFVVKAYGNLSLATEPDMILEFVLGDDPFVNKSTWTQTPQGWVLALPGE